MRTHWWEMCTHYELAISSMPWQLLLVLAIVIAGFSARASTTTTPSSLTATTTTLESSPTISENFPTSTRSTHQTDIMTTSEDPRTTEGSTMENSTMPDMDTGIIITGAVIGAAVAIIVAATAILCIVISMKKYYKRKSSINLPSADSEKSPNRDGYVNALYDIGFTSGELAKDKNGKTTIETAVDSDIAKNSVRISAASNTSKNSKSSKESKSSKADGNNETSNNYYASDEAPKSPGSRSQCSLPIVSDQAQDMNTREKERDKREGSYEYAYATTSVNRISSSTSSSSVRSPQKRTFTGSIRQHSVRQKEMENFFYMAPAMDEHSLYAQFAEIRIRCLARETIKITDLIGSGQFGKVHQGEWTAPGAEDTVEVAVKTLKEGAGEGDKVKFLQEAAIMGQFSHPNVVKLYGVVTEGEPVMIVLELLPKGDLRNHLFSIRNKHEEGDEHTLLSFCRQIAAGMSYLASKSFVHRDLAARNILVSEDGICKIADFGMSRDLMDENYYISHGGKIPVKWTAPEALHFKKFSAASDVWSFGCVMYEIWSLGHKPFEGQSNNQTILEVDEGVRMAPPPGCPRAVYELAIQCWHPETSKRPHFPDIMQRFSLPDTKLLKWSEEDKATDPEAATLGADLNAGLGLYKQLQERYIPKESTNNNNNDLTASKAAKHDSTSATQKRDSATKMATPAPPKTNVPPVMAAGAGAHSYEDPSFLTFFQEDISKLQDLAGAGTVTGASSDTEKPEVTVVTVAGGVGHSYEDPMFVEALSEGNAALSSNV